MKIMRKNHTGDAGALFRVTFHTNHNQVPIYVVACNGDDAIRVARPLAIDCNGSKGELLTSLKHIKQVDAIVPSTADTVLLDTIAVWTSPTDLRKLLELISSNPNGGESIAAALMSRLEEGRRRKGAEAAAEAAVAAKYIESTPARTYEEAERDASGEPVSGSSDA